MQYIKTLFADIVVAVVGATAIGAPFAYYFAYVMQP